MQLAVRKEKNMGYNDFYLKQKEKRILSLQSSKQLVIFYIALACCFMRGGKFARCPNVETQRRSPFTSASHLRDT